MSFNIGLSGLYAANKQLDVTGNNIANVATTGFKSSRAEFEDVYSATKLGTGSKTVGNGVRLANVSQQFGQGDVNNTGNVLDMGIQGSGFFVLSNNGSLTYTRAGTFKTDKDGYITNSDGTARLQGYGVDSNGKIVNGVLTDLRIDTSNLSPKATTAISSTINLNSTATNIDQTVLPFDPTNVSTYTKSFSTSIYDTQGNAHTMDQYMVKTAANTWQTYTLVDGRNPDGSAYSAATQPSATMTFNSSGTLTGITVPAASPFTVSGTTITMKGTGAGAWVPGTVTGGVWAANGAAANATGVAIDMTSTTQYNADTARSLPTQDGYATGQITNLTIDDTGTLFANFSNSQNKAIGQVSLASFTNEQGLQAVGGTSWRETYDSGIPGYDAPTTGTLGSVVSNSLEESNVNLTNELVDLIKAQSNYQANAKTISTQSTIMQTIIQMT
ncbi:flagellar hook-basal body protein [Pseudomonas sp. GM50]|jgi:flagellar hook protein FlgE|uniref:flagellar hook protein FlgE n=1 Tax=Pseudomonas sp. GM50 TaxID=1144332 RepID=UPI000270A0D8|nr:flagellar hook protein FlgE [Pseudomonas sp. GM50]EJM63872.1 flagellar hook-basal body protein [Pseudomonas sp. GM50]